MLCYFICCLKLNDVFIYILTLTRNNYYLSLNKYMCVYINTIIFHQATSVMLIMIYMTRKVYWSGSITFYCGTVFTPLTFLFWLGRRAASSLIRSSIIIPGISQSACFYLYEDRGQYGNLHVDIPYLPYIDDIW